MHMVLAAVLRRRSARIRGESIVRSRWTCLLGNLEQSFGFWLVAAQVWISIVPGSIQKDVGAFTIADSSYA